MQILLVEPFELGAIENGIGSADAGKREALDQFGGAEHFSAIPAGPAEEREKIAESFRQEAFVAIGAHAGGAVAFGEAGAVGAQDERDVRKDRRLGAESAVEQDLFGRVGNVIGAANDMGDAHVDVIDNSAELVGGQGRPAAGASSRAHEDEILDFVILHFAGTEDGVFEFCHADARRAENELRGRLPFPLFCGALGVGQVSTGACRGLQCLGAFVISFAFLILHSGRGIASRVGCSFAIARKARARGENAFGGSAIHLQAL